MRAVQDLLPTRSAMVAVTGGERRFMAHAGVQVTQEAVSGAVCRLVARRILQAAQTMDTGAVVDLLGVQRTRVQHLLEAGDLYAYRDGRRNRFRCGSSPMTDVRCRACERCWPRWGLRTGRWSTGPWQPRNPTFPGPVRWTRGTGLPAAVIPRWWSSWPVVCATGGDPGAPAVTAFRFRRPVRALDLTGGWPLRAGASHVINTGRETATRACSRHHHSVARPGRTVAHVLAHRQAMFDPVFPGRGRTARGRCTHLLPCRPRISGLAAHRRRHRRIRPHRIR